MEDRRREGGGEGGTRKEGGGGRGGRTGEGSEEVKEGQGKRGGGGRGGKTGGGGEGGAGSEGRGCRGGKDRGRGGTAGRGEQKGQEGNMREAGRGEVTYWCGCCCSGNFGTQRLSPLECFTAAAAAFCPAVLTTCTCRSCAAPLHLPSATTMLLTCASLTRIAWLRTPPTTG